MVLFSMSTGLHLNICSYLSFSQIYEPVTKGCTKNGTMHSKFHLRNLTKISEFKERTNNYLQKNNLQKITEKITDQTC